jgi:cytochrome c biogenesis protein CcmG/thiol:disulfide interchange protein DsbE
VRHATIRAIRTRLLVLLATAVLLAACGGGAASPQAKTGAPVPPIKGTAIDGSAIDLAAYKGHPVIVNFWASWCVPCREEFPLFQQKLAELGPADGLVVLGVLYKDEPELAQRFLDDFGAAWPTVTDPDGTIAADYRVVAPPQTYFIDKDGVLRAIQIGQVEESDFATQYAKIKP